MRRFHIVVFNSVLPELVFKGLRLLFYTKRGQDSGFSTFEYASTLLLVVGQVMALYDGNRFLEEATRVNQHSWKGIKGVIPSIIQRRSKKVIDHPTTLEQITIDKPIRQFICSDLSEMTHKYSRVFKYLTVCYLIRYVCFLVSIATLQHLPGLNLLILLVFEVIYWLLLIQTFYRFKDLKSKLVIFTRVVQSALFFIFFFIYFFNYSVLGLRVNLS